jgi:hypothetical protein
MENWYTGYSDLGCWLPIVPENLLPAAEPDSAPPQNPEN